jgi:hypothetical protein
MFKFQRTISGILDESPQTSLSQEEVIRSNLFETGQMIDTATLKLKIQLEEHRIYAELFEKINNGHHIKTHEMAIVKNPQLKKNLIDLIIQRQVDKL